MRRRMNRSGAALPMRPSAKSIVPRNRLTNDGLAFLKCAFAPPDFSDTQVRGIPDNYRGKTLLKKHRLTASTTLFATSDGLVGRPQMMRCWKASDADSNDSDSS